MTVVDEQSAHLYLYSGGTLNTWRTERKAPRNMLVEDARRGTSKGVKKEEV